MSTVSALAFKSDFDAFLLATIGADNINERMQLSVLSALARLDIDPWEEAAALSRLSREMATQKLTLLLAALPDEPSMRRDAGAIAARLIPLLPQRAASSVQSRAKSSDAETVGHAWRFKSIIIYAIYMGLMLAAQQFVTNPASVAPSDKPPIARNATVSSQAPPQDSAQRP